MLGKSHGIFDGREVSDGVLFQSPDKENPLVFSNSYRVLTIDFTGPYGFCFVIDFINKKILNAIPKISNQATSLEHLNRKGAFSRAKRPWSTQAFSDKFALA